MRKEPWHTSRFITCTQQTSSLLLSPPTWQDGLPQQRFATGAFFFFFFFFCECVLCPWDHTLYDGTKHKSGHCLFLHVPWTNPGRVMTRVWLSALCQIFPNEENPAFQQSILDWFLNSLFPALIWHELLLFKNWFTSRPRACRAGPLELTVLHTLHSLLPDILRNVPRDLFFFLPQRSSLEWQIASCHKAENINMAQQKVRSEGSDTQGGKWIGPHLIPCDSSSRCFTLLSVWRFCWFINVFFFSFLHSVVHTTGKKRWALCVHSSQKTHGPCRPL